MIEGRALAASGNPESWASAGAELIAAADAAGEEPASHVHVATEDGEAFAVRHEGLVMVAVAERFTLASLMIFDMRAVFAISAGATADAGLAERVTPKPQRTILEARLRLRGRGGRLSAPPANDPKAVRAGLLPGWPKRGLPIRHGSRPPAVPGRLDPDRLDPMDDPRSSVEPRSGRLRR